MGSFWDYRGQTQKIHVLYIKWGCKLRLMCMCAQNSHKIDFKKLTHIVVCKININYNYALVIILNTCFY